MSQNNPFVRREGRWLLHTDALALIVSVLWVLTCNLPFWREALAGRELALPRTWFYGGALFVGLVALHFVLLGLVLHRRIARPLLALLITVTAFAVYATDHFGIHLDPGTVRGVLHTDAQQARELFSWAMLPPMVLYLLLPLLMLLKVEVKQRPPQRAFFTRLTWIIVALLMGTGAVLTVFQDLDALVRKRPDLPYLITPANCLYALAHLALEAAVPAARLHQAVGTETGVTLLCPLLPDLFQPCRRAQ